MKVVYKATNKINGKSYIGFDSYWPKRISQHERMSRRGSNTHFHNAIRKYGESNFEWTVLLENATLQDESRLIKEYETFSNGYNLTMGGEGTIGHKHTEEYKLNKSKRMGGENNPMYGKKGKNNPFFGKKHSEETKHKMSIANKGRKRKKSTYGYKHTSEAKHKMSESKRDKRIYKLNDLEGNEYIVDDIRDFCKKYDLSVQCMQRVATGHKKHKQHKGWTATFQES